MLNYEHRFHGRASLNRVHRHGKIARSPLLALKYLTNDRRRSFRCAIVVSRKVHGSAVVRNRIRRRLYETIRQIAPGDKAYDLVFIVFNEQLARLGNKELHELVNSLLKEAGATGKSGHRDIIRHEEK